MPIANCPFPNQKLVWYNQWKLIIYYNVSKIIQMYYMELYFLCETFSFKIMVNVPFLKKSNEQNSKVKYNTMINMGNNSRLMSKVSSRLILSLKTGKVITVVINRSIEFLQKCSWKMSLITMPLQLSRVLFTH